MCPYESSSGRRENRRAGRSASPTLGRPAGHAPRRTSAAGSDRTPGRVPCAALFAAEGLGACRGAESDRRARRLGPPNRGTVIGVGGTSWCRKTFAPWRSEPTL